MVSTEMAIFMLNSIIISVAYFSVYPKLAGKNINKVAIYDCLASGLALIIVASKYWGSDVGFDFLMFELNWFWFTLLSYSVLEIPVALWYFKGSFTKRN